MYSYEDRIRAVKLYIKLGKRIAATLRQLGYSTKNTLKSWYREYVQSHDLPAGYVRLRAKYSHQQKMSAVEHYLSHGQCLAATVKALGFPRSETLAVWIYELHPDARHVITCRNDLAPFEPDVKYQAVSDLCTRDGSTREVAQKIGVSRQILYKWKNNLIGDETYQAMRKRHVVPSEEKEDVLLCRITQLEIQVHQLQLERDILTKANELVKKDQGINNLALTSREKTQVVDALRETYPLAVLLDVLKLARSCYFYHRSAR
ncbi:Transposase [Serratia proteamaculans]|nr:Transposase [Serratia proteamaculans]